MAELRRMRQRGETPHRHSGCAQCEYTGWRSFERDGRWYTERCSHQADTQGRVSRPVAIDGKALAANDREE